MVKKKMKEKERRFGKLISMYISFMLCICVLKPSYAAGLPQTKQISSSSIYYLNENKAYLDQPQSPQDIPTYGHITDVEGFVSIIRGMYNTTNNSSVYYSSWQRMAYAKEASKVVKAVKYTGDSNLDQLMHHYGYSQYSIEFYYDNPNYSAHRICYGPNFIYAVIDGREYRYYFADNQMIRRIGPEGLSNNPETNDFMNQLYKLGWTYQFQ